MMITDNPKVKRLLQRIADCKDLDETKKLAKDLAEMLGNIILDLEAEVDETENKLRTTKGRR